MNKPWFSGNLATEAVDVGQGELAESAFYEEAENNSGNGAQFENLQITIPMRVKLENQIPKDDCYEYQDAHGPDGRDETSEMESRFDEDTFYAESVFSGTIDKHQETAEQYEVSVGSFTDVVVPNQESDEESLEPSEVDVAIEKACLEMRTMYGSSASRQNLDFNNFVYQKAYAGLYLGTHLTVVSKKLSDFWLNSIVLSRWLKNHSTLNVASIGGGPGTDILGINLFLEKHNLPNFIEGTIYDIHNWEKLFKYLVKVIDAPSTVAQRISQFIHCDPFNFYCPIPKSMQRKLHAADMVTIVKFFSIFPRSQSTIASVLESLIAMMKPGAMLFIVDSAGGGMFEFVCEIVKANGMRLVQARLHENIQTCPNIIERLKLNRKCCSNCNPQRYTKVSAVLYQKVLR